MKMQLTEQEKIFAIQVPDKDLYFKYIKNYKSGKKKQKNEKNT